MSVKKTHSMSDEKIKELNISRQELENNSVFNERIMKLKKGIDVRKNEYFKRIDFTPELRQREEGAISEAMNILNKLTSKLNLKEI